MLFLNILTGEYPRHQGDMELLGWRVGEPLPENWVEVLPSELPADVLPDHKIEEVTPVEIDGVYIQTFEEKPMTAEEIERRDAPKNAKAKLLALGLTEQEVEALVQGLIR